MTDEDRSMTIKAIQTRYKGYHFRSRLEAMWAVYFDAIGLQWEYEPEGFCIKDPWNGDVYNYLPDFWLPQVRMWAEVKPGRLSDEEFRKCCLLAWHSERQVLLLTGTPSCCPYVYLERWHSSEPGQYSRAQDSVNRSDCMISMYHQYPTTENRFYGSVGGTLHPRDFEPMGMFDDVPGAVAAARVARFEHGETPGIS